MCTTSGRSPAAAITSAYCGSSVVRNDTSVTHQPCSSRFPCSMSLAWSAFAAPSESTGTVPAIRR